MSHAQTYLQKMEKIWAIEEKVKGTRGLQFSLKKSPHRYHVLESSFAPNKENPKLFVQSYEHISLDENKTITKTFTFDPSKIKEILDDNANIDAPCVRMMTVTFTTSTVKEDEEAKTWKTEQITKVPTKTANKMRLYYFGKTTQDFNKLKVLLLQLKKEYQ